MSTGSRSTPPCIEQDQRKREDMWHGRESPSAGESLRCRQYVAPVRGGFGTGNGLIFEWAVDDSGGHASYDVHVAQKEETTMSRVVRSLSLSTSLLPISSTAGNVATLLSGLSLARINRTI